MNRIRHRIISLALDEVGTIGGERYGASGLWCGAFCAWILRESGLTLPPLGDKAGAALAAILPKVVIPRPGDIARYANSHCAIVLSYSSGGICTVDGAKLEEPVCTGVQLLQYTQPVTFYSIDELIRQYEMTGAETPQDVR